MPATRLAFLVNGGPQSAMGIRAQSFAQRLETEFEIRIVYRAKNKVFAIARNLLQLAQFRPALCYVFDMGFSGILAAGIYRMFSRCRVVVDTGDAILELSRSAGTRGHVGLWLTAWLERFSFAISDRMVVRSRPHQEMLAAQGIGADVIPDAVDLEQFRPCEEINLRRELGLEGLVVGILGSLVWNPRLEMCYGSEVVEVISRLRDQPLKGLVIGDGTGLAQLKSQAAELGIADRIVFAGRIPYDGLPRYLNLMDICISTQTNDTVGQVRTSGKLPLYLACGRFVLATAVGEAARVLPQQMLVTYNGTKDNEYPARLAERVHALVKNRELLDRPDESVAIARSHFDYDALAGRLGKIVRRVLQPQDFSEEPGVSRVDKDHVQPGTSRTR
jgi:glycosyltransferase involved in cell wall biosynthesis